MSEFRKKNPVIGGLLSALFPGIGQIYNEEYGKGIVLIAVTITTISSIVYSGLTILPRVVTSHSVSVQMVQPGPIATLVGAALILGAVWLYGITDAVTGAQRLSAKTMENTAEAVKAKDREGANTLGIVLVIAGVLVLLYQLGMDLSYLFRYGGPAILVLFGAFLLLRGTGLLKKIP